VEVAPTKTDTGTGWGINTSSLQTYDNSCQIRPNQKATNDSVGAHDKPPDRPTDRPTIPPIARPKNDPTTNKVIEPPAIPQTPGGLAINVQGTMFDLPTPTADVLDFAAIMAAEYATLLMRTPTQPENPEEMRAILARLTIQFSRGEAERIALADADNYNIPEAQLQRDIRHLRRVGTMEKVIEEHHLRHQENGPNLERATKFLANDPRFEKVKEIITKGGHIDTPPEFVRTLRQAPFRHMQTRLLPVYNKAVAEMHDKDKVLLFRLSDLTPDELSKLHCANEYHWRPEPGKVAGRPLLDCSNAPPGAIPLNSEYTSLRGVERYQRVTLPTFREIITEWDRYRRENDMQWADMWIFKADITGCFNQLYWDLETTPLMGFMLTDDILMLMLTCGFGVGVTPMIWSEVGDAMNRTANLRTLIKTFTYVDDFLGGGRYDHARQAAAIVQEIIRGVLGPTGLSEKKNVFAQKADILGILVDCTKGTLRPKDKAIEKLFYVAFSVDLSKKLPLSYWQCIQSLTNLYSTVMHGMRPFVAALTNMTKRAHAARPMQATASARFAMEIWRAVLAVAIRDPDSISIPIDQYIGATTNNPFVIVSDASPTGMCAALYHPHTNQLLAWSEFRFPYERDIKAQYQGNREYLGHLFSLLVLLAYTPTQTSTREYMWVNDNIGALQWAATQKCSSNASHYANLAVSQIHIHGRLRMVPPEHKPGITMGDIDLMSRLAAHENPTDQNVQERCPTLTPSTLIMLSPGKLRQLFILLDPHSNRPSTADHHTAFVQVHRALNELILSFHT